MKSLGSRWVYAAVSMLTAGALALGVTTSASANSLNSTELQKQEESSDDLLRVTLELQHPLSLRDAISASERLKESVVAYAFTAGAATGEYAPESLPANDFLKYFAEDYGTQPQVTGFVVARAVKDERKVDVRERTTVGSEYDVFVAPPVVAGGSVLARQQAADVALANAPAAAQGKGGPSWIADFTAQAVLDRPTGPYVGGYFAWRNAGPALPDGIGLEFEVNMFNPSVAAPNNLRPACFDLSFKDRFWAKNYGYTWVVYNTYGVAPPDGAYADINDTLDLCQTQSMAIGVRYPETLTSFMGEKALDVQIFSSAGLSSSSAISGNIQAVSAQTCEINPLMSLTNCMGVWDIEDRWAGYPAGNYNQLTLNVSRDWVAPGRCWQTVDEVFSPLTSCS